MDTDRQFICNVLCVASIVLFLGVIWIFTSLAAYRKIKVPDTDTPDKLLYVSSCLAAPLIAMGDLLIKLGKSLLKILAAILGVILVVLILLASPVLLIIYLAIMLIKNASVMGDHLLERTIEFPDRTTTFAGKTAAWFANLLERATALIRPPSSPNS